MNITLKELIEKEFSGLKKPTVEEYSSLIDESYKYHNKLISEIKDYSETSYDIVDPDLLHSHLQSSDFVLELKSQCSEFQSFPENLGSGEDDTSISNFFSDQSKELHKRIADSNLEKLDPSSCLVEKKAQSILENNHFSKIDSFEWNLTGVDLTEYIKKVQADIRETAPASGCKDYLSEQYNLELIGKGNFPDFKAHFKAEQLTTYMRPWDNKFLDVVSHKCDFPEFFSHVTIEYVGLLSGNIQDLDLFLFLDVSKCLGDPTIPVLVSGLLSSINMECMKEASDMEPFSESYLFLNLLKLKYPREKLSVTLTRMATKISKDSYGVSKANFLYNFLSKTIYRYCSNWGG